MPHSTSFFAAPVVFLFALVSRRAESGVLTAPMIFAGAGLLTVRTAPDTARADADRGRATRGRGVSAGVDDREPVPGPDGTGLGGQEPVAEPDDDSARR